MIRARVRAFIDEVLEKIMQKSAYRDPYRVRVNGRWVSVDEYSEVIGPHRED